MWDQLQLISLFESRIAHKRTPGRDGVTPAQFRTSLVREINTIMRKTTTGTYRFTPYLELLRVKSRNRLPRVISIPTVRDRITLGAIREELEARYPEAVDRRPPNQHVRELARIISTHPTPHLLSYLKLDLTNFYGTIPHKPLLSALSTRVPQEFRMLIRRAIQTPTLPSGYARGHKRERTGVPQGLPISSVLANIYALELDEAIKPYVVWYNRYVDDILIICLTPTLETIYSLFADRASQMGLRINHDKKDQGDLASGIEYLGYRIEHGKVTVKAANVHRLLRSIASLITKYRRGRVRARARYSWLTEDEIKRAFIEDLNEKITGAISGYRRYGWLFYFIEITDVALLHFLDDQVRVMVSRVPQLATEVHRIKSFVRAYHKARFSTRDGYIHNYDTVAQTVAGKRRFLESRGELDPRAALTDGEVDALYEAVRRRRLVSLESDIGTQS